MRGTPVATALATVLLGVCLIVTRKSYAALPPGFTEAVLQIQVNGSAASEMVVALRGDNFIWLDAEDFARMRLRTPDREPLIVEGIRHFPLEAIEGATVAFDEPTQTVSLTVPPSAFVGARIELAGRPDRPIPEADFGGFANYEFSAEHNRTGGGAADTDTTFGTAFTELGFFGPHGVVTNSLIGYYTDQSSRTTRLETTWSYDFPARMQTLRVGDAISSGGRWSRAIRFGGVQFGSNFATRPDLVTLPLLSAAGEAVVPSTVDVFVNNQQVAQEQVPAGPFVIDRLPAISGAGDVRLVVRDTFGREQVITAPFYSSASLLQQDLSVYSIELGKVRENYAIESNDYGALLASGTYRRGLSDRLTMEAHGEFQQDGPRALGLDAALSIGTFGVVSVTAAYGADDADSGVLAALGFERSGRRFSINLRSQIAGDGFRQIGDTELTQRPKQQHIVQGSANFYRAGTLALAYATASYENEPSRDVGTLTHSISIRNIGYLSLTVSRTWSQDDSTNASLIFTAPLGATRSGSLSARYDKTELFEEREAVATFQQNPPIGSGTGFRVSASTEGNYFGSYLRQFDSAAVELAAAKYQQTSAARATLTGGAVALGGGLYATRSVNDSFALVEVAGVPDMDVMVDNQLIRRTDEDGRALIRNLRAYDINRISVDARQLPLDTRIDSDKITVTPRFRSGVVVRFPIVRERAGVFRLVQQDGKPVPTGAEVSFKGNMFPVAMDGYVYVTGLDHGMAAEAEWKDGRCAFRVGAPSSDDPLPDMGTIVCRAVAQ